ncbi:hypothetical protein CCP2SC5_240029 [Azospirillaceae bacterium]
MCPFWAFKQAIKDAFYCKKNTGILCPPLIFYSLVCIMLYRGVIKNHITIYLFPFHVYFSFSLCVKSYNK